MHAAFHVVLAGFLLAAPSAVAAQDPPTPAPADTVPTPAPLDSAFVQPPIVPDTGIAANPPILVPVRVVGSRPSPNYSSRAISTATRTAMPLRDIPQSVTVINRELIADQSMRGMAEVVRYVPGITMGQGEGNRDQPTIRGNSTTADFFVDGVRDDAQYFRDLYNVEQVEALKGSNAMIFGRGGGGGVINRAMKEAGWNPVRELMLQGGSYRNRRTTLDAGQGLTDRVAGRVNAVFERSDLFRDGVMVKRQGVHPTLTFLSRSENTRATFGYENFNDYRVADRGIPSFGGVPVPADVSTFFGNPALSYSNARVHSSAATISQRMAAFSVRNTTRFTTYDKIYQNVFPGAVSTDGAQVSISAYNSAHTRRNLLNQTDLTYAGQTGRVRHTLLLGAEVGRQVTDNFRNTGYFNDASTSISVPVSNPTDFTPLTFRQSATDADNHVTNSIRSVYGQDQISFSDRLQLVAGVRYESFGIRYHDNRTGTTLERTDAMLSPRVGVVVKPVTPASLYASYSVSYLPSAGDQFSSLTDVTKALEPEQFRNFEIGAKWDIADRIAVTAAAYQLDRTNTRAPSPGDPTITVQTGSQRSRGYEVGINGSLLPKWEVAGGFARQQARITSTTASAREGLTVPVVPASAFSLWNRYQVASGLGIGLGVVHQAAVYAAIDNAVRLPAFTRVDGGLFLKLGTRLRAQMNLENVLNAKYYPLAHNNNNITPGSPRAVRLSLTTGF